MLNMKAALCPRFVRNFLVFSTACLLLLADPAGLLHHGRRLQTVDPLIVGSGVRKRGSAKFEMP